MAEKTAVEWLDEQLDNLLELFPSEQEKVNDLVQQAKELETKQRQEDTNHGYSQGWEDGNEGKEPMRPTIKSE